MRCEMLQKLKGHGKASQQRTAVIVPLQSGSLGNKVADAGVLWNWQNIGE
jgi:hypothetical protein